MPASNQHLADRLADLHAQLPNTIAKLRGDQLTDAERDQLHDTFAELTTRLRLAPFEDGTLPVDH